MKNKKILIIALFLILFCLLGYSKSFASTDIIINNISLNEKELNFINNIMRDNPNYRYYAVITGNDGNKFAYFYSSDIELKFYIKETSFNSGSYALWCNDDKSNTLIYKLDDFSLFASYDSFTSVWITYKDSLSNKVNSLYCNFDVYSDNTYAKVLFQGTPQGIVAQQVEEIQLSQTLQEVIAILPMTLVVLVSLVGLRKGLKMLETFLRQS